jgi:hypothetical protein
MNNHTMPEEVKNICKAIAKAAFDQGLLKFSGSFRPEYSVWGADVSFSWEMGRHGEDMNQISITSTFYIHEKIKQP